MTTTKMKDTTSYSYDDQILCEILSRLPLKPLVRFKCVSKSWQFLIEKDQWLIDLHHSQQLKTNLRLLMMLLPRDDKLRALVKFENYWTANLCLDTNKEITRTTTTTVREAISNKDLLGCKQVLKPINGMICLIDKVERKDRAGFDEVKEDHAACLYNIITQESTPWIRSTYLAQVEQWHDLSEAHVTRTYEFGFDPATKEYKVICIWRISGWLLQNFEGCGEYTSLDGEHRPVYEGCYRMCEILTLGKDTAWRRIDKVPPSGKYYKEKHGSVCVNGSIYWMDYENSALILVAFDVGSEEYRVISDLDFISYRESGLDFMSSRESFYLMELDGHLAIKKNTGDHNNVNLWILDDDCDKNISSIKWTKEIITLPLDRSYSNIRFHVVAGTEYLILECYGGYYVPPVWVHCYNRKNKTSSRIKITGDGSPTSLLGAYIGHPFHIFTTYVESLLTLEMSHRPATKAPDTSSTKTEESSFL